MNDRKLDDHGMPAASDTITPPMDCGAPNCDGRWLMAVSHPLATDEDIVRHAVSEEDFFSTGPNPYVGDGETAMGLRPAEDATADAPPMADDIAGVDIEVSRKLFLIRLSLEDTMNSLDQLERFVSTYIASLEHRGPSSMCSRTQSMSVDPFKLSRRPLEDIAEDVCSRVQAVTERLEACPEMRAVMASGVTSVRRDRPETSPCLKPFHVLQNSRGAQNDHCHSIHSVGGVHGDTGDDDEDELESKHAEGAVAGFSSTFGPLVNTLQLNLNESCSSASEQPQKLPRPSTAVVGAESTFGPMIDTFTSHGLDSTVDRTPVLMQGDQRRPGRGGSPMSSMHDSITQFISAQKWQMPAQAGAGEVRAGPLEDATTRRMQVDLQQSNPPPWLMRVPSRMTTIASMGVAGQASGLVGAQSWQYVDPMSGTPVSLSTFGDYVISERSSFYDRHHVSTQTSPMMGPLYSTTTAALNAKDERDNASRIDIDAMSEDQLRVYVKQLQSMSQRDSTVESGLCEAA